MIKSYIFLGTPHVNIAGLLQYTDTRRLKSYILRNQRHANTNIYPDIFQTESSPTVTTSQDMAPSGLAYHAGSLSSPVALLRIMGLVFSDFW